MEVNENGVYSGEFYPFTLAGFTRKKGISDASAGSARAGFAGPRREGVTAFEILGVALSMCPGQF